MTDGLKSLLCCCRKKAAKIVDQQDRVELAKTRWRKVWIMRNLLLAADE